MPARLAIQASRVHNAWLCLIWIVLFFRPRAKKAMRSGNATTMAASRHPDHRPEVTPVFRSSCGLRLRRSRQTASALRRAGNLRRSASPSAPGSGAKRPAEK